MTNRPFNKGGGMGPLGWGSLEKFLRSLFFCFACLLIISCGAGHGENGNNHRKGANVFVAIVDGTETSPIPGALCSLVDFGGSSVIDSQGDIISGIADDEGTLRLQDIPLELETTIECHPEELPNLVLTGYLSTIEAEESETLPDEVVEPASTVVTNILRKFRAGDPQREQFEDLTQIEFEREAAIESGLAENKGIRLIVDAAVALFEPMFKQKIDTIRFSNQGETSYGALEDLSADGELNDTVWQENAITKSGIETAAASLESQIGVSFEDVFGFGSIRGRVTDGDGNPIVDRDVTTLDGDQGDETDANGEFLIQDLPEGPTALIVQGFGQVATVAVIGTAVVSVDIVVRTGNIYGQVTGQAAFPQPLEGYTVIAIQNGIQVGNGSVSDANGHFLLENIPVGETLVTFQTPPTTSFTEDTVTVVEDQTVSARLTVTIIL
jgi:hypothetical protein